MSNVDPTLRFPSGRTIKDVKNDAKRFAKTADISHTCALDTLARVNGLDMCWSAAVCKLSREQPSEGSADLDLDAPPRIYHIGLDSMPSVDLEQSESLEIEDTRVRPRHRMRLQRLRHALQLYREGHLSLTAIADVCGVPVTQLYVHICRMNSIEKSRRHSRDNVPNTEVRLRRSPYQRKHEPQ